jgi:hypothetical protein|tara:strand:- start:15201 stop:15350 length:150 start_codon:yes stop_codon:yes gene_type:complete
MAGWSHIEHSLLVVAAAELVELSGVDTVEEVTEEVNARLDEGDLSILSR